MLEAGSEVRLTPAKFLAAVTLCMTMEEDAEHGAAPPKEVTQALQDLSHFLAFSRVSCQVFGS